jgi:hypothetical protein
MVDLADPCPIAASERVAELLLATQQVDDIYLVGSAAIGYPQTSVGDLDLVVIPKDPSLADGFLEWVAELQPGSPSSDRNSHEVMGPRLRKVLGALGVEEALLRQAACNLPVDLFLLPADWQVVPRSWPEAPGFLSVISWESIPYNQQTRHFC